MDYTYNNLLKRADALSWLVAWLLMLLLWISSNKLSVRILSWKWWKRLHSLVYPTFIISVIHVAYASRFDNFYIFLLVFVIVTRTIAYASTSSKTKKSWPTTKYICIPCSYIYDENLWDPDGWLEPWTKFEDIPDDWVCPICGVGKEDFEKEK